MTKYGIADIGSNTMVLMIYEYENNTPEVLFYHSEPVHLIGYVKDGIMSEDGIRKAFEVLKKYDSVLDQNQVSVRYACITEPGRIANREALLTELRKTSFRIIPLSGEEEAECEYLGSRFSFPDLESGIAFDVGGGSSELIAFADKEMKTALSLPIGAVRMMKTPLDTETLTEMLKESAGRSPAFERPCRTLLGIGGTIRAAGMIASAVFGTGHTLPSELLGTILTGLAENNELFVNAMKQTIPPSRHPLLIPGFRIVHAICDFFEAETILISETNVREGFLLKYALKDRI